MNGYRVLSFLLIMPLFLYLGFLMVTSYAAWDPLIAGVFGAILLLNAIQFVPWKGRYLTLSGLWVIVLIMVLGFFAVSLLGGPGLDVAAGIILASPFLIESWIWQLEGSPGKRMVALQLSFLEGVVIVAAIQSLLATGLPVDAPDLISAYAQVNITQACSLSNLVGLSMASVWPGACSAGTLVFPLQAAMTPPLVVLGGMALVGALSPVLKPQTGSGAELPFREAGEMSRMAYDPELEHLGEKPLQLLALRTVPKSPSYGHLPGLRAIFLTAALTFAFVLASLYAPQQVLLPTLGALVIVVFVILGLTRASLRAPPPVAPRMVGTLPAQAPSLPVGLPVSSPSA